MRREVGYHQPTIRGRQPPTTIERWHPTYKPRPNYAWRFRVSGHDRAIDRSPIRFRLPGPPSALWRRGFFQGAIMPSVANLPAAVFDVRYAPNSDQILQRSEMTLCAKSGHRDKLFWTSVVIPTTCRCHHSARACAVSGAVMPVPCGLTTVYPPIDRTCSRVKPWPELPSCTSQLLPPTWFISTNT